MEVNEAVVGGERGYHEVDFYDAMLGLTGMVTHEVQESIKAACGEPLLGSWWQLDIGSIESTVKGISEVALDKDITPEKIHAVWMEDKLADGWTYGEVKDMEKKTHPCLVPFSELPEVQKLKDYVFIATVRSVLDVFSLLLPTLQKAQVAAT